MTVSVDRRHWHRAVRSADLARGQDPARPVLTSFLLEVDAQGAWRLVTTDSYRLVVAELGSLGGGQLSVLLDAEAALRSVKGKPRGVIEVSLNAGTREAVLGDVRAPLVEGDFPNWRQLLPSEWRTNWTIDQPARVSSWLRAVAKAGRARARLDSALEEVSALEQGRRPKEVKAKVQPVCVDVTDGLVRLELGEHRLDLGSAGEGESLSVLLNADYLADAVEAARMDGSSFGGSVTVRLRDGLKPLLLEGPYSRALLMPVRNS